MVRCDGVGCAAAAIVAGAAAAIVAGVDDPAGAWRGSVGVLELVAPLGLAVVAGPARKTFDGTEVNGFHEGAPCVRETL